MIGARFRPFAAALLAAALAGCADDESLTEPPGPASPDLPGLPISLRVDVGREEVKLISPTAPAGPASMRDAPAAMAHALLGANEVSVVTSNFIRSETGEFLPGKVRIRFDVAIANRLAAGTLETPTFPRPPLGDQGLHLFPFSISQVQDAGEVAPSTDWDQGPHNFFNDDVCAEDGESDCSRYEVYPSPLAPESTTDSRTIGFDIDPQVRTFQLDLLLAADIRSAAPPGRGSIGGAVSSPERGPLPGVTVTLTPGSRTALTDTTGRYRIDDVPAGSATLALTGLPSGCTDPGARTVTVPSGDTATADFDVNCTTTTEPAIRGSVHSDRDQPLAGVTVTATPGGQTAVTGTDGEYEVSVSAVSVTLALSNLAAGCLDPGSRAVRLTAGAVDGDFVVPCPGVEGSKVRGSVRDDRGRPLGGVTVTAMPGGQTGVTDAEGAYEVPTSAVVVTLALGNLPAGCLDPGPRLNNALAGAPSSEFSVPCPGADRTAVRGRVLDDRGRALSDVTVTATPGDRTSVTDADGRFEVQVSTVAFTLTLGALPAGCLDPGPISGNGSAGAAIDPNFSVPCPGVEATVIRGSVLSDRGDPLAGVTVTASPGGQTGVTGLDGRYEVPTTSLSVTLVLGNLPAGCLDPGPRTVNASGAVTPEFTVPCTRPEDARISGSVTTDGDDPLAGVTVTVSPGGETAVTGSDGRYDVGISAVAVTLTLGGLPAGCLDPGPRHISIASGALDPSFLVPCPGLGP